LGKNPEEREKQKESLICKSEEECVPHEEVRKMIEEDRE